MFPDFDVVPNDGDDSGVDLHSAANVGDDLLDGFAVPGFGGLSGFFSGLLYGGLGLLALESGHAGGQDHTRLHGFALIHQDLASLGGLVVLAELFPADQAQTASFFIGRKFDYAVDVGQDGRALGHAGLEEFFHPGQTAGDVQSGDAAGVERPHG